MPGDEEFGRYFSCACSIRYAYDFILIRYTEVIAVSTPIDNYSNKKIIALFQNNKNPSKLVVLIQEINGINFNPTEYFFTTYEKFLDLFVNSNKLKNNYKSTDEKVTFSKYNFGSTVNNRFFSIHYKTEDLKFIKLFIKFSKKYLKTIDEY